MAKAKDTFLLGFHGVINAGEDVPATYLDTAGEHDTDFESLAERGLIDKAAATRAEKAAVVETAETQIADAKAEIADATTDLKAAKPAASKPASPTPRK